MAGYVLSGDQAHGMSFLSHHYSWDAAHTGGQDEGETAGSVQSIVPGLGMLANAHPEHFNVMPAYPTQTHAGGTRGQAGAGSFTHYQEYRWYDAGNGDDTEASSSGGIQAGDEVFVNYGSEWNKKLLLDFSTFQQSRPVEWLKENGM